METAIPPEDVNEKYEIIMDGYLDSGTYGAVLKVKRKKDGLIVVKKTQRWLLNFSTEEEGTIYWKKEVEAMERLRHPNIVLIYDSFQHGQPGYFDIYMEYCNAGSLLEGIILKVKGSREWYKYLDVVRVARMFKQICDGLAYCHYGHDKNLKGDIRERPRWPMVLHRDLKPQNLLVHFKSGIPNINEDAVYKLADFGSAFYWRYTNVKAETYGGTEEFWAPELKEEDDAQSRCGIPKGSRKLTMWSVETDIWALGKTMEKVLDLAQDRVPEEDFSELTELVQKCLEKEAPKKRPSSLELEKFCSSIIERRLKSKTESLVLQSTATNAEVSSSNIDPIETSGVGFTIETSHEATGATLPIKPAEGQAYTETEAYEAVDFVSQGAFGIIQKVRRLVDGKILARKTIRLAFEYERAQMMNIVRREIAFVQRLQSPFIVALIDYELFSDRQLDVYMEYCEGGDLMPLLGQHKDIDLRPQHLWVIWSQVASALAYCHYGLKEVQDEGDSKFIFEPEWVSILHRDVKPSNILSVSHPSTWSSGHNIVVKLADFGVGFIFDSNSDPSTYAGTLYFMPPEVHHQTKAYNAPNWSFASDIWSLGKSLERILTSVNRVPDFKELLSELTKSLQINPSQRPTAIDIMSTTLQHQDPSTLTQGLRSSNVKENLIATLSSDAATTTVAHFMAVTRPKHAMNLARSLYTCISAHYSDPASDPRFWQLIRLLQLCQGASVPAISSDDTSFDVLSTQLKDELNSLWPKYEESQDADGRTPLQRAVIAGSCLVVRELLERGANPLTVQPLHWCYTFQPTSAMQQEALNLLQKAYGRAINMVQGYYNQGRPSTNF